MLIGRSVLLAGMIGTLAFAGLTIPSVAAADGDGHALDVVERVAPNQGLILAPDADLVVEGENATVELPTTHDDPVVLTRTNDGARVEVDLPREAELENAASVDGRSVVYGARGRGGADVVAQALADGSVQIQTVIGSADSPHTFTYDVGLPEDAVLRLDDNGGVVALGSDGAFLVGFAPPWAAGADGASVPTWYRVEGSSVVQVVEPGANVTYPVVADPWLGIALIDNVTRSYYSGQGYRYFVYPSWWGRVGAGALARWAAWSEAKSYYYAMDRPNLTDQFYCHFDGRLATFAKGSWNLESWRPDVSYAATLAAGCNP
jgi:Protein of unknown function (DUF2599).